VFAIVERFFDKEIAPEMLLIRSISGAQGIE
jgi:hypothetical protein